MAEIKEPILKPASVREPAIPKNYLTLNPVMLKTIDVGPLTREAQESRLKPYHLMSICQDFIYVFDGLGATIYKFSSNGELVETLALPSFPNNFTSPLDMNFTVFQDAKKQHRVAIFDQDKQLLMLEKDILKHDSNNDSKWKTLSNDTETFVGETSTARLYAICKKTREQRDQQNREIGFFFEGEWNRLTLVEDDMPFQDMTVNATQILITSQNHVLIYNKQHGNQMAKIKLSGPQPLGIVSLNETMFVVAQRQLAVWSLQETNDWKQVHEFGPYRGVVYFGDGGSLDHHNPRCVGLVDHQIVCLHDNNSDRLGGSLFTGVQHLEEPCEPQLKFYSAPNDATFFDPQLLQQQTNQQKRGIIGFVMMLVAVCCLVWFAGIDLLGIFCALSIVISNIFVPAHRRRCGCQNWIGRPTFRTLYDWATLLCSLTFLAMIVKTPLWGILGHFEIHPPFFATTLFF